MVSTSRPSASCCGGGGTAGRGASPQDIRRTERRRFRGLRRPARRELGGRFTIPRSLRRQGRKTLNTVRDDDGGVWVLFRERKDGSIRKLMLGSLDGDELVMVKIRGDVDGMFEQLRDEGILMLPGIVHTDLDPEEGEPAARSRPTRAEGPAARPRIQWAQGSAPFLSHPML